MFDVLIQIGAAKLVVSTVLAGLAWMVKQRAGHPANSHPLWLLVLAVLLLPAVVALPVLPGGNGLAALVAEEGALAGEAPASVGAVAPGIQSIEREVRFPALIGDNGKSALVVVWLAVAALLLVWTLARALRFRLWFVRSSRPAVTWLRREVAEIGHSLGLARMPEVHTTTARVSPMVYWTGGSVRLVIPSCLLTSLDRHELRAVLAHELAHVRRRDHLVRWIEWLACSAFWWNPVAWFARRELRAAEEASCDALGVTALNCAPRDYAKSLLRAVELLSKPPTPPIPAFASGTASNRSPKALERRIRMLISGKSTVHAPRWKRAAGATAIVCLLPLGLVYCGFADQPLPTSPEDAAESPSVARSEATASHPAIKELRYRNVEGDPTVAAEDGPVLAYVVLTASETVGPHALATAPGLPQECRLDPVSIDACSNAMKTDIRLAADTQAWGVCVGDLIPDSWQGKCLTWDSSPFSILPVFAEIFGVSPGSEITGVSTKSRDWGGLTSEGSFSFR